MTAERESEILGDLEHMVGKPYNKWGFKEIALAGIELGKRSLSVAEETRSELREIRRLMMVFPPGEARP